MPVVILYLLFLPDLRALGAPEFAIRERAEARLSLHADLVYSLLPVSSPDLEVRRRARRVRARAVPEALPPIALLSGCPLAEWHQPDSQAVCIGTRPGPDWCLAWLRPAPHAPLSWLVGWYHERARTQVFWRDWHSNQDGREATRLLVRDLAGLGVPPVLVRRLVAHLQAREQALLAPG